MILTLKCYVKTSFTMQSLTPAQPELQIIYLKYSLNQVFNSLQQKFYKQEEKTKLVVF